MTLSRESPLKTSALLSLENRKLYDGRFSNCCLRNQYLDRFIITVKDRHIENEILTESNQVPCTEKAHHRGVPEAIRVPEDSEGKFRFAHASQVDGR